MAVLLQDFINRRRREYYQRNRERVILLAKQSRSRMRSRDPEDFLGREHERRRLWRLRSRDAVNRRQRLYYSTHSESEKASSRKWYSNNKARVRKWRIGKTKERYWSDGIYRLSSRLRSRLRGAMRGKKSGEGGSTFRRLGYSPIELYTSLCYGGPMPCPGLCGKMLSGIEHDTEIDHVIPLATAKTEDEIYDLFRMSNLRLMCSSCNNHRPRKVN